MNHQYNDTSGSAVGNSVVIIGSGDDTSGCPVDPVQQLVRRDFTGALPPLDSVYVKQIRIRSPRNRKERRDVQFKRRPYDRHK
jgi:hypothetical protein